MKFKLVQNEMTWEFTKARQVVSFIEEKEKIIFLTQLEANGYTIGMLINGKFSILPYVIDTENRVDQLEWILKIQNIMPNMHNKNVDYDEFLNYKIYYN